VLEGIPLIRSAQQTLPLYESERLNPFKIIGLRSATRLVFLFSLPYVQERA